MRLFIQLQTRMEKHLADLLKAFVQRFPDILEPPSTEEVLDDVSTAWWLR